MDDLLREFLAETREHLDVVDVDLVRLERASQDPETLARIFRLVHTIKGTCGFLGLQRLEALAHAVEDLMGQYRDGAPVASDGVSAILASMDRIKRLIGEIERSSQEPAGDDGALIAGLKSLCGRAAPQQSAEAAARAARLEEMERAFREAPGPDLAPPAAARLARPNPASSSEAEQPRAETGGTQTIRVSVEALDQLMITVSELVLARNQLLALGRGLDREELKAPLQRLSNVTAELQQNVIKTRMQPIGNAWQKLPRQVRELARDLGKTIDLDMSGADTELDRQVLEMIKDPLTHLVRNACDHGLEPGAERRRLGKPETGSIRVSARHEGGYVLIEIADDGRGLDTGRIAAKAIQAGLATEAEIRGMNETEIRKFIFRPGFSTASKVTNVSGRGVGLDVVRSNIEAIGGSVDLTSAIGAGTAFLLKIPLTLAIVPALIVEAAGQRFALPQLSVVELVRLNRTSVHRMSSLNGASVLRLRDRLLPVVGLASFLELEASKPGELVEASFVVVVRSGRREFGLAVDRVAQTEEIVVKPLPKLLRGVAAFAGATILGDGSVILILDPNGVASSVCRSAPDLAPEPADVEHEEAQPAYLLFRAGSPGLKAVPLALVTRLEEIETAGIERCNGQAVIPYRGALLRLVEVEDPQTGAGAPRRPVLVFTDNGRAVGLLADEIVDIVEEKFPMELTSQTGRLGSAIIRGRPVELVDVAHYLVAMQDEPAVTFAAPGDESKRVLLVDDSAFFRNMLAPLLGAAGYAVTLAGSAREALALKAEGARFDIIVSDIEMPEMDGIGLAETIRADQAWGPTPIIALSSQNSPGLVARTRAAGFVDHVGKFDRRGLLESLAECRAVRKAAA